MRKVPDYVYENVDNLRQVRNARGLSVNDLELFSGVSDSTIYNYEAGDIIPTRAVYNRLAGFFGWQLWPQARKPKKKMRPEVVVMLKFFRTKLRQWQELALKVQELSESSDLKAQSYGVPASPAGRHSDPVARRYQSLESWRQSAEIALASVRPVIEEYLALKNSGVEEDREMFLILERHYGDRESIEAIAESLGTSARTLYRRKEELARRAAERLVNGGRGKWQEN